MQKNIYVGMEFETFQKLCDYLGWEFNGNHPDRMKKKLSEYMTFHKEGKSKIVIDEVFCDMKDMILKKKKPSGTHRFKIGDVLEVHSGKIKILDQIKIEYGKKEKRKRVGYKCKCLECGYIFHLDETNILNKVGCGCCNGKVVVKGINDIWTTKPEIAKLLANEEDGYKYTAFSKNKLDFKCPICGEILTKTLSNISNRGLTCPCQRTSSIPNRMMYWTLRNLNINFENEKCFLWSNNKRYDFYLPDTNTIIEMNGLYHYQKRSFSTCTIEKVSKNDEYKYNLALNNGIENYIVVECKQSYFSYMKNNILNSYLSNLLNLENVNWDYVNEKLNMSLILTTSTLWNKGIKDYTQIGNEIGLSCHETVKKYIRLARKYNYILK